MFFDMRQVSRYHAFAIHLAISLFIFFCLAICVRYYWYPDFFYAIDGGWEGSRIIIGVDLVLGPILTLVIFKVGKPGLKFDLSCIALIQITCLIAGMRVVYSERPQYFIYYEKHFYSANADTYKDYGLSISDPTQISETVPAKVISLLPVNPIEEAGFRRILYQDGIPVWVYRPTYELLDEHMLEVFNGAETKQNLLARDPGNRLTNWLYQHGGDYSDYAFLPIHSRYRDAYIGIRKADGKFVDIVEIPPPL